MKDRARLGRPWVVAAAITFVALMLSAVSSIFAGYVEQSHGASSLESLRPLSVARVLDPTFRSAALGMDITYTVYLPPGYDSSPQQHYPVLYMLHGLGGDRHEWQDYGLFASADALIRSNAIQPMIIVTPEGQRSYWVDAANGGPKWGTYISRDLVAEVDRNYRTMQGREYRAIGGDSMGAHGALQLALTTDIFGVVGAHSIALRRFDEAFPMFGDRSYFEAHDPVSLCKKYAAKATNLVISMDIGNGDRWLPAAQAFHDQLQVSGLLHAWKVNPGGHDAQYWSSHVVEYLQFYSAALASPPSS